MTNERYELRIFINSLIKLYIETGCFLQNIYNKNSNCLCFIFKALIIQFYFQISANLFYEVSKNMEIVVEKKCAVMNRMLIAETNDQYEKSPLNG